LNYNFAKSVRTTVKLGQVIEELVEERGLNQTVLADIISEGMKSAYEKRYPEQAFEVVYNKKTDEIDVRARKRVVSSIDDELFEVSLRKARQIDSSLNVGDQIFLPFEGPIGRIEILRAKQVIATQIRKIEATAIFEEFKDKAGTIVHGVVHKCERGGATIKIGDTLAFLPKSLSVPGEHFEVGLSVKALLKEVLSEPRNDNQLILDRASSDFLKALFELEIPEIYERLVEIKKIVRRPGYKSKVVVASNDKNIDPVGTCVGVGGARIKPILKELGSEKIDIIPVVDSQEEMIAQALKPAVINRVELIDNKNAQVWLDEDQRSLAIGKMGQNIDLASQLVGVQIHLVQPSKEARMNQEDALVEDLQ
jgi:transcription termination/antitermination protein NusA